jgi:hypothetical protein
MDKAELKDYEYHYDGSTVKVFALGNNYYCAVKAGKKAPKRDPYEDFLWTPVRDSWINANGWTIFHYNAPSE